MSRPNHGIKASSGNVSTDVVLPLLTADLLFEHRRAITRGWRRSDYLSIAETFHAHQLYGAVPLWQRLAKGVEA